MKHFFPDSSKGYTFLQTNRSDTLGSLWSTFNTDFQSNLGAIRLPQKLVTNTTTADDADLGLPSAFEVFSAWYAVCGTRIFSTYAAGASDPNNLLAFAEDASTNAQTDYDPFQSDLEVFDNRLWASTTDGLFSLNQPGGTWTSRDTLVTGGVHKLKYFRKFNRLYYANDNDNIRSIDDSNSVASSGSYFLDLDDSVRVITTIEANSDFIWVATAQPSNTSQTGTRCSILTWDGISSQITKEYVIEAAAILALHTVNDRVYALDSNMRVLHFTGTSFGEIARLPVGDELLLNATVLTGASNLRPVHFNGIDSTKNNTLLINVNNRLSTLDTGNPINENLPSGIWEVDLSTGNCTHRSAFTLKPLASSTITDFGQNRISAAGAIKVNHFSTFTSPNVGQSRWLAGATIFTNATSTTSGIYVDSPVKPATNTEGQKKGYFVTTWFNSSEIEDMWTRLWSIHKRFATGTDSITYKYRFVEEAPLGATITWVNTTSFTTTTNVTAYGPTATGFDGTKGGEFEGIQGTGSGATAHITNISEAGGTYTVTLDTAITGVTTGTAKARFQKWLPLPSITDNSISYGSAMIGKSGTRIQIKACMSFTGDGEFHKMALFSNELIKINS